MDEQQQKLIERIRQAQNILVTVSSNPSVDQLAAAIGLTLVLNKLDKHGTAVFSGQIPSTMEFLKPEETLEKNVDSLRDFIIALDKSKADKLRYKVEDEVVRIFITPYRTSLSQEDLNFSQGDFNVDVVICLGVTEQQDLDAAITAHGRILHDATVASISTVGQGSLGTINWVTPTASSLSEMMVGLADGLDKKLMDGQIATALLTGIVATTERFRNEKTTPKTMSVSSALMAAGANQQLIATELDVAPAAVPAVIPVEPVSQDSVAPSVAADTAKPEPGMLEINHEPEAETPEAPAAAPAPEPENPQIQVDEDGQLLTGLRVEPAPEISQVRGVDAGGQPSGASGNEVRRERIVEPPKMPTADLTANAAPEKFDPPTEELTLPAMSSPLLSHSQTVLSPAPSTPLAPSEPLIPMPTPYVPPQSAPLPTPPAWQPPQPPQPMMPPAAPTPLPDPIAPSQPAAPFTNPFAVPTTTLADIEKSVDSPHLRAADPVANSAAPMVPSASIDDARDAVQAAYTAGAAASAMPPITALNAQPLGPALHTAQPVDQAVPASPFTLPPLPSATPAPVTNTGFSEPTPGNTPADDALDMPLPSNPFGPGQAMTPPPVPGAFPSAAPTDMNQTPPPPVPPPMQLPPLQ